LNSTVDHDLLNDALRRCGANWTAAQAHGLVASRLAVAGLPSAAATLNQVLEGTSEADALRKECVSMLQALWEGTHKSLTERLSAFTPLLPDDEDSAPRRVAALAEWCEGYLHGLVSMQHGDALKKRLAEDPLADIIKDMLQITRASVEEDDDEEESNAAYLELVEYIRVSAQLFYEELADMRPGRPQ
jgi:yecA family protein